MEDHLLNEYKEYNDDGSYIKKDKLFGYRIIYPFKNPDRSINWFNVITGGSWGKLIVCMIIVLLILFSVYAYKKDVANCLEVIENPCDYCDNTILINPNAQLDLSESWSYEGREG